jgi:hypothetical protein
VAMYCPWGLSVMGKTVIRSASQSGKVEAQRIYIAELQTSRGVVSVGLMCDWSLVSDSGHDRERGEAVELYCVHTLLLFEIVLSMMEMHIRCSRTWTERRQANYE